MSLAYSASTAYDYRRYTPAEPEVQRQEAAAARPVRKSAVLFRRAVALSLAVLTAAVCIGYLYVKAQVFGAQREVNDIRHKIEEAQKLNSTLDEQLSEAMNVNSILTRARALGMDYPKGDQVLYVSAADGETDIKIKR